jgi:hypothetical protein
MMTSCHDDDADDGNQCQVTFNQMNQMDDFTQRHRTQLDHLNIPEPLFEGLQAQWETVFVRHDDEETGSLLHVDNRLALTAGSIADAAG